jgi:hypothetical protein
MAPKRLVTEKVADEKLYEKLRRDLDILPDNHADVEKVEAVLNETKARMVARA